MNDTSPTASSARTTPWHVWVVGILALLWNASGAYTIVMAQAGQLPDLSAEEVAYYAAQPFWFMLTTDIALFSAIAAAVALLMRSHTAVWLFMLSLAAIVVTNTYDLAVGDSRALANVGALIVTVLILVIAILELLYTLKMKGRSILR